MRWLAYAHPAWMVGGIGLAALTLRAGLLLRRARRTGGRRAALRRRHLRLAKPAVAVLAVGFAAGPVSVVALRNWEPLRSFHGWLGLLAVLLFGGAALLGRRIERGRSAARDAHALLGALALLAAAVAAIAGLAILP